MPTKEGKKTGNKLYNEWQQKQKKLRTQRLEFYLSRGTMWIIYIYKKKCRKVIKGKPTGGQGAKLPPPTQIKVNKENI